MERNICVLSSSAIPRLLRSPHLGVVVLHHAGGT